MGLRPSAFAACARAAVAATWLSLAAPARADPGTVVAPFGTVRARPDPTAPVLATLAQRQSLWLSADPVAYGWFEARLADGRVGYIAESEVVDAPTRGLAGRPLWVALGFGGGAVGSTGAFAARLEIGHGLRHGAATIGFTYLQEGGCAQLFCDVSLPRLSNSELSLRYGVYSRRPGFGASLSVGPAAVWTVRRGSLIGTQGGGFTGSTSYYDEVDRFTLGATAEGGVALSSRSVSFGPTVHLTANPVQPSFGLTLDLHVGYLGEP
jgi:hypothetical protein